MKKDNFIFDPKKWLGDASILNMDWDVRGMHIHLMCYAAQQKIKGHLIYDESIICKVLNITKEEWVNRIKNQILCSWKIVEIEDENGSIVYIKQNGLVETFSETQKPKKQTTRKKPIEDNAKNSNDFTKFYTDPNSPLVAQPVTQEERNTIWTIGIKLLKEQNMSEQKARAFLGKIIKQHGEKNVANCLAQLSIIKYDPAQVQSYIIGMLSKNGKKTNRGSVSL